MIRPHDGDPTAGRAGPDRRTFLRWGGATGAAIAVLGWTACDDGPTGPRPGQPATLDFSSDVGVLNYAFALEQLEAAFYTAVVANLYAGVTSEEREILTDLRDHEIAHREFFRAALGGDAIGNLEVDFSSVNFSSRASVLATAQTFEDLGVAAYNGAGRYLESANFLTVAGKIVSVEARHASVIRDLNADGFTADFAPTAFDPAMTPMQVLAAADAFITTDIQLRNVS